MSNEQTYTYTESYRRTICHTHTHTHTHTSLAPLPMLWRIAHKGQHEWTSMISAFSGLEPMLLIIYRCVWAMVLLGSSPQEFAAGVQTKSRDAYALLLKAARPVLHYGSQEEDACLWICHCCSLLTSESNFISNNTICSQQMLWVFRINWAFTLPFNITILTASYCIVHSSGSVLFFNFTIVNLRITHIQTRSNGVVCWINFTLHCMPALQVHAFRDAPMTILELMHVA